MQHNIVQSGSTGKRLIIPKYREFQHEPAFFPIIAGQHGIQRGLQLLWQNIGEKTESAAVDAEHRYIVIDQRPGRIEHAAIAPHNHHQVTLAAQFMSAALWQRQFRHQFSGSLLKHNLQAASLKKLDQPMQRRHHAGVTGTSHQTQLGKGWHKLDSALSVICAGV